MDGPHKKKVNRIVWKSSKAKLSKKVLGENDQSSKESQDLTEGLHPDPLQPLASEKTTDLIGSKNDDITMKFQDNMQKGNFPDPMEWSVSTSTYSPQGPHMLPLLPILNRQDDSSSVSIVFGGTACRGETGPPIGALDIGVSKSAYYFRIALPGVNKDPGEFSCEIEHDGKVHVRGVTTTGGDNVSRHSRLYHMKFQQQCPPGPFTLSFCLPGPVDPRLFSPNFRSDGIFEAVVMKYEE